MVIMIDKGLNVQFSGFTLALYFWRKDGVCDEATASERRAWIASSSP
jgi:hypothetical protein